MGADAEILARAEQRVGSTLCGKYRIDRVLGIGGMAVVYVATHRMQKQFALKMLHPELSMRSDIRQRFLREGIAANTVGHAGAVSVVDNDTTEDGAAFLVMELLDGAEVEALWEGFARRMPGHYVLAVAHQLLDVLAAAHGRSIVHRDIKPQNLFVTHEGQLKVLDFGIARVRDAAVSAANATSSGLLLGTPAFMAPEQALAKSSDIDGRTDLWAVGATMYTLLTGQYVHEGENGAQVAIKAATTPARPLASLWPEVPKPLAELVDRALAFGKDDRWSSAAEMRDTVRAAQTAVFGRTAGRETLAAIWKDIEDALARTQENVTHDSLEKARATLGVTKVSPTRTAVTATPSSDDAPTLSRATTEGATLAAALRAALPKPRLALVGGTTAQPVSSEPPQVAGLPRRRPRIALAMGAAGVLLLGGATVLGVGAMGGKTGTVEAIAPAAPFASRTAPTEEPPAAPVPIDSTTSVASAVPAMHAPPLVSPDQRPVALPRSFSNPSTIARPALPPSVAFSSRPASSDTARAPASVAPAPTCHIVTEHDDNGQPHFKKVCE